VIIEGYLDADTRFKRLCAVNTEQIDLVIGRGEADISIDHPAISRAHARLQCDTQSMTLSDLGSSNGTFIRGIPCLPGEIMFIETEDEIFLGDVGFRISVLSKEVEAS
jgi:pSer/pThr/pTyr-binding forkhead associated (FHA) protein